MKTYFIKKTNDQLQQHIFFGLLGAGGLGMTLGTERNLWSLIPITLIAIWYMMKCGMMRGQYTAPIWCLAMITAKLVSLTF